MKLYPYFILAAGLLVGMAHSPKKHVVEGEWLTAEGGQKVTIAPCGDKYCGKVSWLKDPSATKNVTIGTLILKDFTLSNAQTLEKGQLHDTRNDKWYKGKLTVGDDGKLEVRAWVGLPSLGKSIYWTRAN